MASEYTTHYNLDLYTDTDKPNLRDQYNGAMNKIDSQLNTFSNNMVIVTDAANQAKEKANTNATEIADEVTRAKAAEQANAKAIDAEKTRAEAAERTLKSSIDTIAPFDVTPTEGSVKGVTSGGIYSALNNAVPANASITSEKLANGSVTSEKLANASVTSEKLANASVTSEKLSSDALTSLIHGMSIRRFGNAGGTDNDGLVLPSGNTINVVLDGLYVPELTLLLICDIEIINSSTDTPYQSTFILPSYIPYITGSAIIGGCVEYSSTNSFANWHNIRLLQDGSNLKLIMNTNDMTNSCASMGACAVLLRAYGAE